MTQPITIKFNDGTSHIYTDVPDDVQPEDIYSKAKEQFADKQVVHIAKGQGTTTPQRKITTEPTKVGDNGLVTNVAEAGNWLGDNVMKGLAGAGDFVLNTPNKVVNLGKMVRGLSDASRPENDVTQGFQADIQPDPDYITSLLKKTGAIPDIKDDRMLRKIGGHAIQGMAGGAVFPGSTVKNALYGGVMAPVGAEVAEHTDSTAAGIAASLAVPVLTHGAVKAAPYVKKAGNAALDAITPGVNIKAGTSGADDLLAFQRNGGVAMPHQFMDSDLAGAAGRVMMKGSKISLDNKVALNKHVIDEIGGDQADVHNMGEAYANAMEKNGKIIGSAMDGKSISGIGDIVEANRNPRKVSDQDRRIINEHLDDIQAIVRENGTVDGSALKGTRAEIAAAAKKAANKSDGADLAGILNKIDDEILGVVKNHLSAEEAPIVDKAMVGYAKGKQIEPAIAKNIVKGKDYISPAQYAQALSTTKAKQAQIAQHGNGDEAAGGFSRYGNEQGTSFTPAGTDARNILHVGKGVVAGGVGGILAGAGAAAGGLGTAAGLAGFYRKFGPALTKRMLEKAGITQEAADAALIGPKQGKNAPPADLAPLEFPLSGQTTRQYDKPHVEEGVRGTGPIDFQHTGNTIPFDRLVNGYKEQNLGSTGKQELTKPYNPLDVTDPSKVSGDSSRPIYESKLQGEKTKLTEGKTLEQLGNRLFEPKPLASKENLVKPSAIKTGSQKIADGKSFDLTAEELAAWNHTKGTLAEHFPEFKKLSDAQIAEKMGERAYVQGMLDKIKNSREILAQRIAEYDKRQAAMSAAERDHLQTKADKQAYSDYKARRESLNNAMESLQEMLGKPRPDNSRKGQGPKTRAAQRGEE